MGHVGIVAGILDHAGGGRIPSSLRLTASAKATRLAAGQRDLDGIGKLAGEQRA